MITTWRAASSTENVSSAEMGLSSPFIASPAASPPPAAGAEPKPENNTFASERFIALHMMAVRMRPLVPTRQPATMSTLFSITKPAAHAARPESELSIEITTGMSPPPMGMTSVHPSTSESTVKTAKLANAHSMLPDSAKPAPAASVASTMPPFSTCWPRNSFARPLIHSASLPKA